MKPQTEVIKYVVIDKKDTAKTDRSVHSLDKETITPQDGAALKLKSPLIERPGVKTKRKTKLVALS